jgi:hypothetical protein
VAFRFGPRVAWLQQHRSFYADRVDSFAFGGAAAILIPLPGRLDLEPAAALTAATFPGTRLPDGSTDPDGMIAWVWELRIGIQHRVR